MKTQLHFGLTPTSPCSYLPEQQERLIFSMPAEPLSMALYQQLLQNNFRRTGQQIYRPACEDCHACQSVKLPVQQFKMKRNQQRLVKKAHHMGWYWRISEQPSADYFTLYQNYICQKHAEGVMYPPEKMHLDAMYQADWLKIVSLEQYIGDSLVGVLILDQLADGFSAVYSFYDPQVPLALGTLAILAAIAYTQQSNLPYLYLGYYIEDCQKMAYKANFGPQLRLIQGIWQSFD